MADKDDSNKKLPIPTFNTSISGSTVTPPSPKPTTTPTVPTLPSSIKKVGKLPIPSFNIKSPTPSSVGPKVTTSGRAYWQNTTDGKAYLEKYDPATMPSGVAAPVISAFGGFIDFISMGLAANAGRDRAISELVNQGIVTPSIRNYVNAKTTNMGGQFASFSPIVAPEVTVTDKEQQRLIDQMVEDLAEGNSTAWLRGENTSYGMQVLFGDKEEYSAGEIAAGIAYDIINDPLSFAGSGFVSGVKAAAKSGKAAVTAGVDAARGNVSRTTVAKTTGVAESALPVSKIKEPKIKVKQADVSTAEKLGLPVAEEIANIKQAGTYVTTPVPTMKFGKVNLNVGFIASSALDAGKKALVASLRTDLAKEVLRETLSSSKNLAGALANASLRTIVTKESGKFVARTPSGEKIGTAATELEAKALGDAAVASSNSKEIARVSVDELPVATKQNIPNEPAPTKIELPTQDGGTTSLDINVPYQASDGSAWIYDGTDVKVFSDMEGAQLSLNQSNEALTAIVRKSGKEYSVRAGDYIETFATKSEATAAAKAYNTGEVVLPTTTASGKTPKLDLKPTPQFTVADIGKAKVNTKEGKVLKSILKSIDDIAAKTPGRRIRLAQNNQRLLRKIIDTGFLTDPAALRFLHQSLKKDFQNAVNLVKVEGELETPYSLLKTLTALAKQSSPNAEKIGWLRDLVASITVRVDNSPVSLPVIMERFPNYTKDVTTLIHKQIAEKLSTILDEAKLVATTKDLGAVTESRRYEKLTEVFGKQVADSVKETGVLKGVTAETKEKFLALEKKLLGGYENVAYSNLDELVEGLKNGDSVNADNLKQIFRQLDPDNQVLKTTLKAIENGTGSVLRDIFLREAVQSIDDMKKKVILTGDIEELLGSSGIAIDDIVAAALKWIANPNTANVMELSKKTKLSPEWIEQAILKESPAEQMKFFSESKSPLSGRSWSQGEDMILLALRETIANKFNLEEVARKSEDFYEGVSSLGQKVVKVSKQNYVSETGAVLTNIFGQADEFRMVEKVMALTRGRISKGITSGKTAQELYPASALGKEAQTALRNAGADKQIDEVIHQVDKASALLSTLGIKITRTKEANDIAFDAAFEAEKALAKSEGRPVNFNRKAQAHFAYLHMGDIFRSFTENGGRDILRRGFFPIAGKTTYDKNTMSLMGLGDAARRVLELDGKNTLTDTVELVDELTKRILQKTGKMKKSTDAFAQRREGIAREMAEHLVKPEVVAQLREAHLTKAIGASERFMKEAKTINDDILNTLRDGMRAASEVGNVSDTVRLNLVRQYLRKLALAGKIFAAQGGRQAEDMFTAYSMLFAEYGKLPPSLDTPAGSILEIIDGEEAKLLRVALYKMDSQIAPERIQTQTAAGFKFRKPEELIPYENKLQLAQEVFSDVMSRIGTARTGGTQEAKLWEKEYQIAKTKLERARLAAVERGIETFHYLDGEWIPSSQFNPEMALRLAQETEAAYVAGQSGLAARVVVDTTPVVPEYKLLKGKALEKALKFEKVELDKARADKSKKHSEVISSAAIKEIDKYDDMLLEPGESAMHLMQEVELKHLVTDVDMPPVIHTAEELIPEMIRLNTEFTSIKSAEKAQALREIKERWSGTAGKEDVASIARQSETKGFLQSSASANYLERLVRKYKTSSVDDFSEGISIAIATGNKIPKNASPAVQEVAMRLKPLIEQIRQAMKEMGSQGIFEAFQRYGVSDNAGYVLDKKALKADIETVFKSLPFYKSGNAKADEAFDRVRKLEQLEKSGLHPVQLLENMFKALSMVKAEQGLAANITENFGWKNSFDTYEQAVKAGWVGVETGDLKSNIIKSIPSPKDGGLFPPELAPQIGAAVRHWNSVLATPRSQAVTTVAQWTGLFKVFMTVLRPGYHVLNAASETSTAILRGVVNPKHYALGGQIMAKHAAATLPADYAGTVDFISKLTGGPDSLDVTLARAMKVWEDPKAIADNVNSFAYSTDITLVKNGKKSDVGVTLEEWAQRFEDAGILEKNIFINNFQGLDDAAILANPENAKNRLFQKTGLKIAKFTQTAGKFAGDLSMVYNNTVRVAHAMKIIQGKTWSSVDEAVRAAADEIAIFHPTSKSLGSAERRNSALISTFYTWIKMAHVMVYKMMLENNRELYAVNNALYYLNTAQGLQPQSRGTSFQDPEEVSPYQRFRAGQVALPGERRSEDVMIKSPFTVFEVFNTWQLNIDMAKNLDENLSSMFWDQGLGVLARSAPVGVQTALKLGSGRDLATGIEVPRANTGDIVETFVNLLPAVTSPARAAGIDLAQETGNVVNKILGNVPSSQNREIEEQDSINSRLSYLFGVAAFSPNTKRSKSQAGYFEAEREKAAKEKKRYQREQEKLQRESE
jgi:hypothetical protein